ncbi:MAG: serine/threonine protein kinase [Phycisphaerales bacterium]|nr:serine/threonine protein kinase [Phycisphaerales bacterium]
MTSNDLSRDQFRIVESIFAELCDVPRDHRDQIETRLNELCAGDEAIAREVRSLLALDHVETSLIDTPAIDLGDSIVDDALPDQIGQYMILRVLGEGGMGIVYEAQQQVPRRRVALKVIRSQSLNPKLRQRFQREADILAKLNHPGIATIYESGVTDDGRTPYVAMEFIDGVSITEFAKEHQLSTEARVSILRDVCVAVGHAHSVGIVHRDLKPSNIILDRDGRVKVLDFGIATDTRIDQRTMITQTGQMLGTLQYMAPEQVDQSAHESSTRTDVYAIGIVAYELLSGTHPHKEHESSMYDLVRSIRDDDPGLLGTLDRTFRGDLETIIAKALAREQDRRYSDANALADDLERYLTHKPIEARKPSSWYQLRKFSQRNPVLVGSVAAIMLVMAIAIVLISNALRVANSERKIAQQQQHAQELTALFVTEDLFSAGNPDYGGDADITLLDAMRSASSKIPDRFAGAPEAEASISFTMGDQFRLMNDYDKAEALLTRSLELSEASPSITPEQLVLRYTGLSDFYADIDDLDRAFAMADQAEVLLNEHPEISVETRVDSLVQYASLYYYKRDLEQSAEIFQRAVDLGDAQAPEYDGTVSAIGALAMVYTNMGRYEEAQPLHERCIEISVRTLGEEHPATLQTMDNFSIHWMRCKEYQKGLDILLRVLPIRERVLGEHHHKTHMTHVLIGRAYLEMGQFEIAESQFLSSYNALVEVLGPDHRYTLVAQALLRRLYTEWGKPELAAKYEQRTESSEEL